MVEEHRSDVGFVTKCCRSFLEDVDVAARETEALFGKLDRGPEQCRARQRAVSFAGGFQSHYSSRYADGEIAVPAFFGNGIAACIEVHVPPRRLRRLLAEINEGILAVGEVNDHEAAAPEIAAAGMRYRERVAD